MDMASKLWFIAACLGLVSTGLVEYQSNDNMYEKAANGWTPDFKMKANSEISQNGFPLLAVTNNSFTVNIRRSDQSEADKFEASYVTPQLLQKVFELESLPEFLKTESDNRIVPIIPSALSRDGFYTIKGPGEKVFGKMNREDSETTEKAKGDPPKRRYDIPVLSGSAYVGQLYDGINDQILTDKFFWETMEILKANITSVETETFIEESVTDRVSHLSVSASLSISLYAGLIKISGSASYLNDEIETDEYVRMTFKFSKKGRQESVRSDKSKINSEVCADTKSGATHVITEVKYGFNAFLLFQIKKSETKTKQEIGGSLSIVIKKIPGIEISGKGEFNLTESEKEIANSLTFKFHGDTVIDPPPQSFDEAVKVYKSLPKQATKDERVVSFSIAPLTEYCSAVEATLNDISDQNIKEVSEMMEDFEKVRKYLRKLKNSNIALDFQRYRAVLLDSEQRYEEERSNFTAELQKLLPLVRSSSSEAEKLTDLVTRYKASRYEREKFIGFLDTRQKEIETAEFIIYNPDLPSSTYIDLDSTGDMAECVIGHEYALVYELEILPGDATKLGDDYKKDTLNESKKWFMHEEEIGKNRPLMDDFKKLAKKNEELKASICFLVKLDSFSSAVLTHSQESQRFSLTLLKEGKTIMAGFEAPPQINTLQGEVKTKSIHLKEVELSVQLALKTLSLDSSYYQLRAIYSQISESNATLNGPFETKMKIDMDDKSLDRTQHNMDIKIIGLNPGSSYKIEFSIGLYEGNTMITEGETSSPFYFHTLPTTPPVMMACESTWDSITFKWKKPTTGMVNGTVYQYGYSLSQGNSGMANEVNTDVSKDDVTDQTLYEVAQDTSLPFTLPFTLNIQSATSYSFNVKLIAPTRVLTLKSGLKEIQTMQSEKASIKCETRPPTPTGLAVDSVTGDKVTLSWDDGKDLLKSDQFKTYHVWLTKRGDNVESPLMKTTDGGSTDPATFVWDSLESAQGYEVRVTLVTKDFGESEKSGPIHFRTQENTESEKSAIDKLTDTVVRNNKDFNTKLSEIEADMDNYVLSTTYTTKINAIESNMDQFTSQIATTNTNVGNCLLASVYHSEKDNYVLETTFGGRVDAVDNAIQAVEERLVIEENVVWFDTYRTSLYSGSWSTPITYTNKRCSSPCAVQYGTGVFTAPVTGVYQFHFQGGKYTGRFGRIRLIKSGSIVSAVTANGDGWGSLYATSIVYLDQGDRFWAESDTWILGDSEGRIHFTGSLLTTKTAEKGGSSR